MAYLASRVFLVTVMIAVFTSHAELDMKSRSPQEVSNNGNSPPTFTGSDHSKNLKTGQRVVVRNGQGDSRYVSWSGKSHLPVSSIYENTDSKTRARRAGHIEDFDSLAVATPCKPTVVAKKLSLLANDNETEFIPPCMMIATCDGCCGQNYCRPSRIYRRKFTYKKIRDGKLSDAHFTADDHEECFYRCPQAPAQCNWRQSFNPKTCMCECFLHGGTHAEICRENHFFNPDTCECECKNKPSCTGTYFHMNRVTCQCESAMYTELARGGKRIDKMAADYIYKPELYDSGK